MSLSTLQLDINTLATAGFSIFFGTVFLEHIARQNFWRCRPSDALQFVADKSSLSFRFVGEKFAQLSSFLTKIEYKQFLVTIRDLFNPIIQLIGSPVSMLTGYARTMDGYSRSWLVPTGSVVIVGLISYMTHRFCPWYLYSMVKIYETNTKFVCYFGLGSVVATICYCWNKYQQSNKPAEDTNVTEETST